MQAAGKRSGFGSLSYHLICAEIQPIRAAQQEQTAGKRWALQR